MNWQTSLTQKFKIDYPVIQAPMFGVTTPAMVAAAANVGCLGSLAVADLPAEKCVEAIRATRQLTSRSFGVNIFVNDIPKVDDDLRKKYAEAKQFIEHLAAEHRLDVELPSIDEIKLNGYHEQVDAIIAEGIKIVSFTFGNLDDQTIQKLKSNGVTLVGTCTSVSEAKILEQSGIDVICAQGIEAGGHRGSFASEPILEIGGLSLFSRVRDAVKSPLIYAGGICDAKSLMAARALGAQGFQVGSLLLGSTESALKEFEREKLRSVDESEIMLTKSFSGRYARGIKNAFIAAMEHSGHILPYPYQNKLTGELRRVSKEKQNLDFVSIWLGQTINNYDARSTAEILKKLIADVEKSAN